MSGAPAIADRRRSPRQQLASTPRKSLKTLQHVATDKENLTGRATITHSRKTPKDIKMYFHSDNSSVNKQKKVTSTGTQAEARNKITAEDLTSEAGPSENYWEVIAEKRRVCLEDALSENKELYEKIKILRDKNEILKKMLEESKDVVDVLQEMIKEHEESGIGLSEESTLSINNESIDENNTAIAKNP